MSGAGPELDDRGLPPGWSLNEEWEVAPAAAARALGADEGPALLDCRQPEELAIAKIEGIDHVPLPEIPGRLDELADRYEERGVIVVCHHGQRSLQAAALLRQAGVENARSLAGGIDLWSVAVDGDVARY